MNPIKRVDIPYIHSSYTFYFVYQPICFEICGKNPLFFLIQLSKFQNSSPSNWLALLDDYISITYKRNTMFHVYNYYLSSPNHLVTCSEPERVCRFFLLGPGSCSPDISYKKTALNILKYGKNLQN